MSPVEVGPTQQRSGAHRPRRPAVLAVVPALLIILVVAGVGIGVWQLSRSTAAGVVASGGPGDPGGADEGGTAGGSTSGSATSGSATSGSATSSPSDLPSSAGSTPGGATPSPTDAPTAGVDQATPVAVLNSTTRSGLATAVAGSLRSAGWSATTGNDRTRTLPTTVFYATSDQRATAEAVADEITGGPPVEQSAQYGTDRITVVLGLDYAG